MFLVGVGVFIGLVIGLPFAFADPKNSNKLPLWIGLAMLGIGAIPWILVFLIWLFAAIMKKIEICYQRYDKQYREYKNIPDPEDPKELLESDEEDYQSM